MDFSLVLSALKADTFLMNKVSGVYASEVPRKTEYPLVLLSPLTDEPLNTLSGEVSNIEKFSIQIDIWSKQYTTALSIHNDIRRVLDSSSNFRAVRSACRYEGEAENMLHRFSVDYSIWL